MHSLHNFTLCLNRQQMHAEGHIPFRYFHCIPSYHIIQVVEGFVVVVVVVL